MDVKSNRFADSVRPEVILKKISGCSLKRHFQGCLRQYVGYVDFLAAKDAERFVWASERDIARHCRKYSGGKPDEKPYQGRTARYCKRFLREQGIISEQITRVRGGIVREGFIAAAHDSLVQMSGNVCVLSPLSSAVISVESSHQSSVVSAPPSSAQNEFEFRSEFRSEFPSQSPQSPHNKDTYGDEEKVCCEFAESLAAPNPEAFKKYEPSNPPTPQTETVRCEDLVGWMAGEYSKTDSARGRIIDVRGSDKILALAAEVGEETVRKSWNHFLRHHRNLQEVFYPLLVFAKDFVSIRAQVEVAEQRRAASTINKQCAADSQVKEREWRRSIWAALENMRGSPYWESKIDAWITETPPPQSFMECEGKLVAWEYAAELVEDVKRTGQRYYEQELAKLSDGLPF
jgi:hypothetical protein